VALFPRKEASSPPPASGRTASASPVPAPIVPSAPATPPDSPPPGVSAVAEPKSTSPPETTDVASAKHDAPPATDSNKPQTDPTSSADAVAATPPAKSADSLAALTARDAKPLPTRPPRARFDVALLARKPTKGKYALAKVLADARSYSNSVVVPTGMYLLTRPHADSSGGGRKLWATERAIQSRRGNTVGMTSAAAIELDVEPSLAGRLDSLAENQLNDKMTIMTVWFPRDGAPQLVQADILQRYVTGFKKGFATRGDVDYETLVVTPQNSSLVKAEDEEWEQPGRMLHFANAYKNRVAAYKNMLKTNEHLQLQNIMGNMWGQMMRDAAAGAAQQQALQRGVGGR
jgi:hypothetical protein